MYLDTDIVAECIYMDNHSGSECISICLHILDNATCEFWAGAAST